MFELVRDSDVGANRQRRETSKGIAPTGFPRTGAMTRREVLMLYAMKIH